MAKYAETPLMSQYTEMKKKHPDAILLFRVGDFYETFSDDAVEASRILGITLTRRANGKAASVELAGFPHHALDAYLPKLVRAGKRVAICEQLEDPKLTKKLVKRGITELVTPGVNLNDNALSARENNFLSGIHIGPKGSIGVAFLDISTGEFMCAQGDAQAIDRLLTKIAPKELLRMHGSRDFCEKNLSYCGSIFELDDWVYTLDAAESRLLRHFDTASLAGFGLKGMDDAVIAAGSLIHYLDLTSHTDISHITSLSRIDQGEFMHLDRFTVRNLELIRPLSPEGMTLLEVIDRTRTPMGARELFHWLNFPLLDLDKIRRRQDGVQAFVKDSDLNDRIVTLLREISDIERLAGKVGARKIGPRDLLRLGKSLECAEILRQTLIESAEPTLVDMATRIPDLTQIASTIIRVIDEDAPAVTGKPGAIARGVNQELDSLRNLQANSKEGLEQIRLREAEATGISSLKIAFNNVFGYYIEVRNTHKDKVPETWIRRQTLVNAERYITPELKDYEERILTASEKITTLEQQIFTDLVEGTLHSISKIQECARAVAMCDCLSGLAEVAVAYDYVRPEVNDSMRISISEGRHPVIERRLPPGEPYISNNVELDSDKCQIMMITGPNMSGKSALLRQTALIVLLAQTGSFVPAAAASIGLTDKIFTRVGASDNISSGESTFMVEMNEAAAILNNMTPRSLILFDELGRGTSTYDGISIAWAIVENIHENGYSRPKTLFATHYHELNEMEKSFSRIHNFNVSVREANGKVVFMRKLLPGGSEHSFGIQVARLAGIPAPIVKRASQVLHRLESAGEEKNKGKRSRLADTPPADAYQLSLFQMDDPVMEQLKQRLLEIDINRLTPLEALQTLSDLKATLN